MLRWGFLMLCLMLTSLTTATAIHARELGGAVDIECSGYVHSEGDGDQRSHDVDKNDPDKAAPHHGTCHGPASILPQKDAPSPRLKRMAGPLHFGETPSLARWSSGPDLRPPIA